MLNKLKKELNKEHQGFAGVTHWLIAILFFFLMWLTPINIAKQFISSISNNRMFTFIIFLAIGGASLLPDLDSSPLQEGGSIAIYQLGILGRALSLICIVISSVVWSVMHTEHDEKPPSQHRMLFHSPFIALVLFVINKFGYEASSTTAASLGWKSLPASVYVIIFIGAISVYLGSSIFFYKILNLIGKQRHTQFFSYIFMIIALWNMWKMPFSQLKLIGIAVSLGYLFHIIGDVFTKGSAPLFFPIPTPVKTKKGIGFRMWWKPYLMGGKFAIETGGTINIILNFVLTGANLFLGWYIFMK